VPLLVCKHEEYYLIHRAHEICHFAINVESIQSKSLVDIVDSTLKQKCAHVVELQILQTGNGAILARHHCVDRH